MLGMSAGSVRVTQHRALERLRHLLDLEARMPQGRDSMPPRRDSEQAS